MGKGTLFYINIAAKNNHILFIEKLNLYTSKHIIQIELYLDDMSYH